MAKGKSAARRVAGESAASVGYEATPRAQQAESAKLDAAIATNLKERGYGG